MQTSMLVPLAKIGVHCVHWLATEDLLVCEQAGWILEISPENLFSIGHYEPQEPAGRKNPVTLAKQSNSILKAEMLLNVFAEYPVDHSVCDREWAREIDHMLNGLVAIAIDLQPVRRIEAARAILRHLLLRRQDGQYNAVQVNRKLAARPAPSSTKVIA